MKRMVKKGFALSSLGLLALLSTSVYAAGYKVELQNASTISDAGDAAAVEDASINWYNSAGDVLLPQQLVGSLVFAYAPVTITGTAVAPTQLPPTIPATAFVASGSASSHTFVQLPSIHYVVPVDQFWSLGLSVVPAWGLIEDYGDNSFLRYNSIRIYSKSLDISPSVSWRFNDNWSFGLGPDFHYFAIQNLSAINTAFTPAGLGDSLSHFGGSDWTTGFHIGALYQMSPCVRFGLSYRGKLVESMDGGSDFNGQVAGLPQAPTNTNHSGNFKFRLNLPPVTTFSGYWAMTPNWAFMGTIAYDQWNVTQNYFATNYATSDAFINVTVPVDFRNTLDYGLGAKYTLNEMLAFRTAVKYIDSPNVNSHREPVFPDAGKYVFHIGAHLQYNKYAGFDATYGHVWFRNGSIHAVNPVTLATTDGHMKSHAEIFGFQFVWTVC